MNSIVYRCDGGSGFVVEHILSDFYTLHLTRFRTYKIAWPPYEWLQTFKTATAKYFSRSLLILAKGPEYIEQMKK
jgi:hypothetical protein